MGKAEEIIRRYAEAKEPVEGFGSWLLADRDSAEKEEALSGLWSRIEATPAADDVFLRRAKLSSLMHRIPKERLTAGFWMRRYGWIPLSAAAALALMLVLHRPASIPEAEPSSPELAQAPVPISEDPTPLLAEAVEAVDLPVEPGRSVQRSSPSVAPAPAFPEGGESAYGERVETESAFEPLTTTEGIAADRTDKEEKAAPPEESRADKAATARQWAEWERQELSGRGKKTASPIVGLKASGGLLTAASSHSFSQVGSIPGGIGSISGGDFLGGTYSGSGAVAIGQSTHYDIPVKAVFSLYWPMNDKLYLGVGMSVTSLHSRTTGYLNEATNAYENRSIYAGIPLSLRYDFVSWGKSYLYGAAGVSADYLVKAWTTSSAPTNVSPTFYDGHPLQFSTRLAAGYEYRISNAWSFFGEVSLDYYFKDNSSLDTYFKQHPLSPSVALGVHYNLLNR